MARHRSQDPTELELMILNVLWAEGPCTVRRVRDALEPQRDLARTSVDTLLRIMHRKGWARRYRCSKAVGGDVYRAVVSREGAAERMTGTLLRGVFGGSVRMLVQTLFDSDQIDAKELAELRKLVSKRTGEKSA